MRKLITIILICSFTFSYFACGVASNKAKYVGGTVAVFMNETDPIGGKLITTDPSELQFFYEGGQKFAIPYEDFLDIEYGQKAGRRVGASIATAILLTPVGLFMLFSKKRKHYITIGYTDSEGKEQVALFEIGKAIVRTTLPILEARSGKKIIYQDEEAEKTGKSGT